VITKKPWSDNAFESLARWSLSLLIRLFNDNLGIKLSILNFNKKKGGITAFL
jgi:hypothetical protein